MHDLGQRTWKPFRLGDIADIFSGRDIYSESRNPGNTPYVTSGTTNNGIGYFVGNDNDSKAGNAISVNRNGSIGEAFYHPYPALYGNDCRRVVMKEPIGAGTQLFIARAISMQKDTFSYSRKLGSARLANLQIMLPVNDAGDPDYEHMNECVQEKTRQLLDGYRHYLTNRLGKLEFKPIPSLETLHWERFRIGDLFSVTRPCPRSRERYSSGDMPFVASGSLNNGVVGCCSPLPDEHPDRAGCITVSPVDGSSFFQPYDFLGRGGAGSSILILRSNLINMYSGQFIARTISQTCSKYSYGHMGNTNSIKRELIQLPTLEDGIPDFAYMESYIENTMVLKYQQYLHFLDSGHESITKLV